MIDNRLSDIRIEIGHFHGCSDPEIEKKIKDSEFYKSFSCGVHKVVLKGSKHPVSCLNIPLDDPRIYWGFRGKRKYPSPMIKEEDVKEGERRTTSDYTLIFDKKEDKVKIITCYPGSPAPKEPSTALEKEMKESVAFWSTHALIADEKTRIVRDEDIFRQVPEWALRKIYSELY